jgi:hypothetical protein
VLRAMSYTWPPENGLAAARTISNDQLSKYIGSLSNFCSNFWSSQSAKPFFVLKRRDYQTTGCRVMKEFFVCAILAVMALASEARAQASLSCNDHYYGCKSQAGDTPQCKANYRACLASGKAGARKWCRKDGTCVPAS